jgi:hypothetical protein
MQNLVNFSCQLRSTKLTVNYQVNFSQLIFGKRLKQQENLRYFLVNFFESTVELTNPPFRGCQLVNFSVFGVSSDRALKTGSRWENLKGKDDE